MTSKLDLDGLEGTAIHNERDIANYSARLVQGIIDKVNSITYAFFVRGNWLNLKISKFYSYSGGAHVKLPKYIENKGAILNIQNKPKFPKQKKKSEIK